MKKLKKLILLALRSLMSEVVMEGDGIHNDQSYFCRRKFMVSNAYRTLESSSCQGSITLKF
ncbi:MAG: hypothetical protein LBF27_16445 [Sphingobacterium sp.]|nr:hypothetical protein [Sphingobacterium sp.]